VFVNGRFVHDRLLFRAVMEAYRTYLMKGRYPAAALFLGTEPRCVDVNVHPQKLEVRFAAPEEVARFVVESIRDALRGAASPLGRWGLTERDLAIRGLRVGTQLRAPVDARRMVDVAATKAPAAAQDEAASSGSAAKSVTIPGYHPASAEALAALAGDEAVAEQGRLFAATGDALDDLEVIGQVFAGYIVAQRGERMVLIDQHAAHERVLFERLMKSVAANQIERQGLVVPVTARVGGEGVEAVVRFGERLREWGWNLEPFGDEDVIIREVPAISAGSDLAALVERLVADLVHTEAAIAGSRIVERVMATVACHAAVRVGKRLDQQAARGLLGEIGSVDFAACCPHGRPVARVLDRARIERLFGR
jgi:DNA mismatch repair protein MutL